SRRFCQLRYGTRSLPPFSMAPIKSLHDLRRNASAKVCADLLWKPAPRYRFYSISRFSGLVDVGARNSVCPVLIIRCSPASVWALAPSRFFYFFKWEAHSLLFRSFWLAAQQSWQSPDVFSFDNHHRVKG